MDKPNRGALIRYFLGKSTPEESDAIDAYLALKIDDDYIESCLKEAFSQQEISEQADVDLYKEKIWSALLLKQQQSDLYSKRMNRRIVQFRYAITVAALIVVAFFITRYTAVNPALNTQQKQVVWKQIEGEAGKIRTISFIDHSVVRLFPGAVIEVPSDFNKVERTIRLRGRAFFEVARNVNKPFRVITPHVNTKVLGTSFEINTGKTESSVTLHTGSVSVSHGEKELMKLVPNQQINYTAQTGKFNVMQVDAKRTLGWLKGELDYDSKPLESIIEDMQNWYGVKIRVQSQELLARKVTFSFKGTSIDRVLQLLSKSVGFTYKKIGDDITLSERRDMGMVN